MNRKISLLAFVLLGFSFISAQPLDSLLQQAYDYNPELKALQLEYEAALQKAPQVSQLPDPEVGVGAFILPVETRLGAQQFRISANQKLPWMGTLEQKAVYENSKARAINERIGAAFLELAYSIKSEYYKLYEIRKTQTIINRSIRLFESIEQTVLAKVESGFASMSDVLRLQLKIEEWKQELQILNKAEVAPITKINQLTRQALHTNITIMDTLAFTPIVYTKEAIHEAIGENHPLLRMFSLQQEVSHNAIALNELEGKPSFGVGVDYIMVNSREDAIPENNGRDILQFRAAVQLPLNRKKYAAKEQEEKLRIEALESRKINLLSRYMAKIDQAYADHEVAQLQLKLYQKQKIITRSALKILESEYSATGQKFDELLLLEKELIDYDLKILKAIVQSHMSKSLIERYIPTSPLNY